MPRVGHPLLFAILVALAMTLVAPLPARAQSAVTGTPLSVCIAPAIIGDGAAAMFARGSRFDCTTPQTRFGQGDFWVLSAPMRGVAAPGIGQHVRIASLWQHRVTLYALYPDGRVLGWSYDGRAATQHLKLGGMIEWQLPASLGAPKRLLWRVDGSANLRGVILAPRLASTQEVAGAAVAMAALYSGFTGLCAALLIYNFAMWGALRYRFQLAYCGMVLALLLYALSSSGILAWLAPAIDNNDRLRLNYAFLATAMIAAIGFARAFFPSSVTAGWVGRLSNAVMGIAVVATVALVVLAPWHIRWLDTGYSIAFGTAMLVATPIIYRAWLERSRHLWLFAIAWAAPIAFGVLRLLGNMALVPWSFWLDNSTILSMGFEAVMSTLAIAYRIRRLAIERDEAIEREIIAARLADIDPLTGLLNRRAFLRQAIGRTGDQELILTDLDHFKHVNETLGHDGGDEVLRVFARVLRQAAPTGTLVARMGGEEFAMLCPADHAVAPKAVLERLRAARMPFDITVTTSIGACNGPLMTEADWKTMYRRADRALFDAKQAGRDRARFARAA